MAREKIMISNLFSMEERILKSDGDPESRKRESEGEDLRTLRGTEVFVDDVELPGIVYLGFLRSTY